MLPLARRTALALSLALCAAPLAAEDLTIETARGEVTLKANPATVAVLDISAIDTLAALGVVPAGVPDTMYVTYLDDTAAQATVVGTLFEPNLETLAAMAPDLIIVGGRTATQAKALAEVAPTIDMTIWTDVTGEGRARIEAFGKLFGKQDKAKELIATLDDRIAVTAAAAAGKGNALILLTNGPKVAAYGRGSRFGWIHDAIGMPEAFPNLDPQTHGDAVSFEFIAEVNPDWIIVIDRSSAIGEPASANETLDNPLVAGTTAAKRDQIINLSAAPIYIAGGGYSSMMITLDELAAGLTR